MSWLDWLILAAGMIAGILNLVPDEWVNRRAGK